MELGQLGVLEALDLSNGKSLSWTGLTREW